MIRLLLLLSLCLGCGPDEDNEARLLLDRLEAVEAPSLEERERRVRQLRAMPIQSEQVAEVRDRCAEMHEALLEAELAGAELRRRVEAMEAAAREPDAASAMHAAARAATGSEPAADTESSEASASPMSPGAGEDAPTATDPSPSGSRDDARVDLGSEPSAEHVAALEAADDALWRSNAALERASSLQGPCQDVRTELKLRYGTGGDSPRVR